MCDDWALFPFTISPLNVGVRDERSDCTREWIILCIFLMFFFLLSFFFGMDRLEIP